MCQTSAFVFDFEKNQQICEIENITAKDVKFDYMNNLFLIGDNQISKYNNQNYTFESTEAIDKNIKSASVNIETGEFYLLSDGIYSFFANNFSANAQEDIAPVSISTTTALESSVTIAITTQKTELFATCVSTNKKLEIEENSFVIVLKEDILQNQNVCYCLVNVDGNEEFGFVLKDDLQILSLINLSQNFVTVCTNVKVRTYPSQNAGVCEIIGAENTNVVVLNNQNKYVDFAGNKYYAVQLENGVGYVDETYLAELGTFESIMIDVEPTPTHKQEFVAYCLVVAMLLLSTVFVCVLALKKKK